MTNARQRMLFGRTNSNRMSRFIGEIPDECLHKTGRSRYEEQREYGGIWRDSSTAVSRSERPSYVRQPSTWERPRYSASTIGGSTPPRSSAAANIDLRKGEMVHHDAFGQGMVISITPMGGDALVEIAFDNVGTKRLMYKSAASHMKKQ